MPRVLLALAIIGLTIYAILDCVRSEDSRRSVGPTWLWVAFIIVVPVVGALVWLLVSRAADAAPQASRRPMPQAPDDDPDFLRYLQQRNRRTNEGPPPAGSSETDEPGHEPDPDDDRRGRSGDGHPSDDHPSDGR
ncbi:hypothetical protein GCG21_10805 [Pseudactinotalea sp. HY160]|uniref:PLD nuclease N-terminal domain-containing protein n=1 Tax=Pseudactinotalea sp. HY160 TaxID=2654490 RepID=UPI00128D2145|nr:PLD nuclease N-terminal domain-containing protein [Pseudactinotalea sp. HY160]MPV50483.1 hypothetical protein [Pseudactinotalea sp. HY160]